MKQAKALFGILFIVVGIFLAWKVLPYYYANMELQDFVESQARIESYSTHTEADIAEVMAKKAQELEIPLKADDFKVQKAGTDLTITADYNVHVDVPIHDFDMHFHVETKNHKI